MKKPWTYTNRDFGDYRNRLIQVGRWQVVLFDRAESTDHVEPRRLGIQASTERLRNTLSAEVVLGSGDGCRVRELHIEQGEILDMEAFLDSIKDRANDGLRSMGSRPLQ